MEATETPEASERANELMDSVTERLRASADVSSVYGDPIEREGKTVVPVARVGYGFGGGFGEGTDTEDGGSGSGVGGGLTARPAGVVEITGDDTRFVRPSNVRRLMLVLFAGFVLGRLLGRRGGDD